MKQKTVLIFSLIAGLIAFLLTRQYFAAKAHQLDKERERLFAGIHMVRVVASLRDLPVNTVLRREDLGEKQSLDRDVSKNTVLPADAEQIIGKKLKYSIERGNTLFWSDVDVPFRAGGGLSAIVTPKMRALSVNVSGAAAVSGLVQPNDRVDVLGTFYLPGKNGAELEAVTLTLLQDVTVLAVGQRTARLGESLDRSAGSGYSMVTFEVTTRETELLVFTETMKGRLTLALRNPSDVSYERELPSLNFDQVQKILPELNQYRQITIRQKGRTL
ncbi:MAG: Flp pilus assembly protein CpaB [bacterium]